MSLSYSSYLRLDELLGVAFDELFSPTGAVPER